MARITDLPADSAQRSPQGTSNVLAFAGAAAIAAGLVATVGRNLKSQPAVSEGAHNV